MRSKSHSRRAGLSLLELIVSVALLGIASTAMYYLMNAISRHSVNSARQDTVQKQLDRFVKELASAFTTRTLGAGPLPPEGFDNLPAVTAFSSPPSSAQAPCQSLRIRRSGREFPTSATTSIPFIEWITYKTVCVPAPPDAYDPDLPPHPLVNCPTGAMPIISVDWEPRAVGSAQPPPPAASPQLTVPGLAGGTFLIPGPAPAPQLFVPGVLAIAKLPEATGSALCVRYYPIGSAASQIVVEVGVQAGFAKNAKVFRAEATFPVDDRPAGITFSPSK